jgi:SurA N-terminal domain
VLWRLIKASAIVAGAGLAMAGCAVTPLKMGAAAVVGNQRISIATLDNEVTNLSQAVKQYPGAVNLTATQQTQATLTWLILYQIYDELARQHGITVSPAQAQTALDNAVNNAKTQYEAQGRTNLNRTEILALSGIPPNTADELGRYAAIVNMYLAIANGGTAPAPGSSAETAAGHKLGQAQCQAAKTLNIEVNPQFGQFDYSQYQVVAAPGTVARPAGPTTSASPVATAPAC